MRYSEALAGLPPGSAGYLPPAPGRVKLNQNESPFEMSADDRALLAEFASIPMDELTNLMGDLTGREPQAY